MGWSGDLCIENQFWILGIENHIWYIVPLKRLRNGLKIFFSIAFPVSSSVLLHFYPTCRLIRSCHFPKFCVIIELSSTPECAHLAMPYTWSKLCDLAVYFAVHASLTILISKGGQERKEASYDGLNLAWRYDGPVHGTWYWKRLTATQ